MYKRFGGEWATKDGTYGNDKKQLQDQDELITSALFHQSGALDPSAERSATGVGCVGLDFFLSSAERCVCKPEHGIAELDISGDAR